MATEFSRSIFASTRFLCVFPCPSFCPPSHRENIRMTLANFPSSSPPFIITRSVSASGKLSSSSNPFPDRVSTVPAPRTYPSQYPNIITPSGKLASAVRWRFETTPENAEHTGRRLIGGITAAIPARTTCCPTSRLGRWDCNVSVREGMLNRGVDPRVRWRCNRARDESDA